MKTDGLFSIAVVSFNQRPLIEACIDSILKQNYPNIELIICDDHSCDFDPEEIEKYIEDNKRENIKHVRVFKQPHNVGTSANCQKAFELAQGEFFKLHAADDMLFNEDVLQQVSGYFKLKSNKVLIGRAQACLNDGTLTSDVYPPYENFIKAKAANPHTLFGLMSSQPWGAYVCAPAVFWRSSFLEKLGGFDLSYRYTEDWPLWLKICRMGEPIRYIDDITTIYRYGGISNGQSELNHSMGRIHYEECIRMLNDFSMPIIKEEYSIFSRIRCWHSSRSLRGRIIVETEWYKWSLYKKIMWRIKNIPFLLCAKMFSIRKYGLNIPFKFFVKYMLVIILLANINTHFYPEYVLGDIWSFAFSLGIIAILCGGGLKIAVAIARYLLNFRIRRMS